MARHPEAWNRIFETWDWQDLDLKRALANIGVKFRLVHELNSAAFAWESPKSDS